VTSKQKSRAEQESKNGENLRLEILSGLSFHSAFSARGDSRLPGNKAAGSRAQLEAAWASSLNPARGLQRRSHSHTADVTSCHICGRKPNLAECCERCVARCALDAWWQLSGFS